MTNTPLDRTETAPGYWNSPWPVECGGNRRQKARTGRLDSADGEAQVTLIRNDRWNVMTVRRDPGEWYVGGTMPAFVGPPPFGWVSRFDPTSLENLAESPALPCGDHVWCGAILVHADGSIMSINGSFLHRLDPHNLSVLNELKLPVDRAHNGLLSLSDGTLVTKDLRLEEQGGTTLTFVDPASLEVIETLVLPEGSMGRIAADFHDGIDSVFVPGTEHVWKIDVVQGQPEISDWVCRYRTPGSPWGLAWDSCISDGHLWLMDCGDIEGVRAIHHRLPNGRFDEPAGKLLSWQRPAPWKGAQRLLRVDQMTGRLDTLEPFGAPGGGIIAPPVNVPEFDIAIAWDSINGGLAGISTAGQLEPVWHLDVKPSMQPVVFPESGELVINDFTVDQTDDLIVVDIETGQLLSRVATGSRLANGMFLTAGDNRDVYYCSTLSWARVAWV
ncbi:MAG: hypothetical protein CL460_02785 [Acidimicrobiaceae bacterium]|nr:hypothetical protein [Acidimicrobiaceae bacterium]